MGQHSDHANGRHHDQRRSNQHDPEGLRQQVNTLLLLPPPKRLRNKCLQPIHQVNRAKHQSVEDGVAQRRGRDR